MQSSAGCKEGAASVAPYSQVEEVRRHEPGAARRGDRARVRLQPGTIALLESHLGGSGQVLGAGYQARYTVPFGVAATAAYAVVAAAQPAGGSWTGRDVEVDWHAAAEPGDSLVAEAEILEIDEGIARLRLEARTESGRSLLEATLTLAAVRDGKALPSALVPRRVSSAGSPVTPRAGSRFVAATHGAPELLPGQCGEVGVTVVNTGTEPVDAELRGRLPAGHGLRLPAGDRRRVTLQPGCSARLALSVRADRPHEVNLGRPWPLGLVVAVGGDEEEIGLPVSVADPDPGRLLFVLTEDCETFDGGPRTGDYGDRAVLGNHNDFMDPEDYRLQMIEKPGRMNELAERHGAVWTHFFTAGQRFAAEWAAGRSTTGAWPRIVADLDDSVRRATRRHEYAPHIHFDYDPDSLLPPQPRLVYDAATDGLLPNQYYDPVTNPEHRYHDWDGAARGTPNIKGLGDLHTLDSKTGSLYKSLRYLARLQANQRSPLVARIGTFDFGKEAEDQRTSTRAFFACGLRASSDAYMVSLPARAGGQLFWCREDERSAPVGSLPEVRLAQLAVCHDTVFGDLEAEQRWFEKAVDAARGPGVRVVMSMTHAMFLRGEPDPFRSLEGGSFTVLDRFLGWVRERYPDVRFATATEALVEYVDYYSPDLDALVEPVACAASPAEGRYEFPVRLLGRGIHVGPEAPARVRVVLPSLIDPAELEWARLYDGERVLAEIRDPGPDRQPGLEVTLTARPPGLRLCLQVREGAVAAFAVCFEASPAPRFVEPVEERRGPLLRLASSGGGRYTADLLRLLMNPVAGHAEPVGRRIHPLGVMAMGICLTEGLEAARDADRDTGRGLVPTHLGLRWRKAIPMDATMLASRRQLEDGGWEVCVRDQTGAVICDGRVRLAERPGEARAAAPAAAGVARADAGAEADAVRVLTARYGEALRAYRARRAWRLMLALQKGYALLREGPGPFLAWVWRAMRGRPELETHELLFPGEGGPPR
jgi:acyl-CoA thioesterase FadM